MIRLVLIWLFCSAVIAYFLHLHGGWVWLIAAPFGLILLLQFTVGGKKATCPNCGARIKIGYDTCRYCGWTNPRKGMTP